MRRKKFEARLAAVEMVNALSEAMGENEKETLKPASQMLAIMGARIE